MHIPPPPQDGSSRFFHRGRPKIGTNEWHTVYSECTGIRFVNTPLLRGASAQIAGYLRESGCHRPVQTHPLVNIRVGKARFSVFDMSIYVVYLHVYNVNLIISGKDTSHDQ